MTLPALTAPGINDIVATKMIELIKAVQLLRDRYDGRDSSNGVMHYVDGDGVLTITEPPDEDGEQIWAINQVPQPLKVGSVELSYPDSILDLPVLTGVTHNIIAVRTDTHTYTVPSDKTLVLFGWFNDVPLTSERISTPTINGVSLDGISAPWNIILSPGDVIETNHNTDNYLVVAELDRELAQGATLQDTFIGRAPENRWTPKGTTSWLVVDLVGEVDIENLRGNRAASPERGDHENNFGITGGDVWSYLKPRDPSHVSLVRIR